jgi:hypothetical protein
MWAPIGVALTIGFVSHITTGEIGLAVLYGVFLVLDITCGVLFRLRRTAAATAATRVAVG